MSRIAARFHALKSERKKAFIPYIMSGDPNIRTSESLISLLEDCGADVIELGVPFSDPLADGPTIQGAAERALAQGVTLSQVIKMVSRIRKRITVPIALMTYYNPIFSYGEKTFMRDAANAGVDGVIVPDLPPDEAMTFRQEAEQKGLDSIFLLAPTSTDTRIRLVSRTSSGFIYYVSMTGITGSQLNVGSSIKKAVRKIRALSRKPVCIGFGISTPEEAKVISSIGDGVIIGSALVRTIHATPGKLEKFLVNLRRAI